MDGSAGAPFSACRTRAGHGTICGAACAATTIRPVPPREWRRRPCSPATRRSEEHTSELQSPCNLVCRLLLEKKKKMKINPIVQHLLPTHYIDTIYSHVMS